MSGRVVAVYSAKGGVGKTTLAVNLAWASAADGRSTLLWDLDPQGAASYILHQEPIGSSLRTRIGDKAEVSDLVADSSYPGLSILPADPSLRHLDRDFHELGKKRRLAAIAASLARTFDRIIIDCPPGLTATSDQILRAADIVVVPVIPSPLSARSLEAVTAHVQKKNGPATVLAPVFSMVDRRRTLHRDQVSRHSAWPLIPLASAYERVSQDRAPIGALLPPHSTTVQAVVNLWRRLDETLEG